MTGNFEVLTAMMQKGCFGRESTIPLATLGQCSSVLGGNDLSMDVLSSVVRTIVGALLFGDVVLFFAKFGVGGFILSVLSPLIRVSFHDCTAATSSKLPTIATTQPPLDTTCWLLVWVCLISLSEDAVRRIILAANFGATPKTASVTCSTIVTLSLTTTSAVNVVSPAALKLVWTGCTFFSQNVVVTSSRVKLGLARMSNIPVKHWVRLDRTRLTLFLCNT